MIANDVQRRPRTGAAGMPALFEIVRQSELSGAERRAAVLYMDRLPHAMAKPHHQRLARQALQSLAVADRAQTFELLHGRVAVVWRNKGGSELETARRSLQHLLGDEPNCAPLPGCDLLGVYDLPNQATRLLDELSDGGAAGLSPTRAKPDLKLLARLESTLAQADLSRFARLRPVGALQELASMDGAYVRPMWHMRYFALDELAAGVCPGYDLRADPWLFARLTRTLDLRMLALLMTPGELMRNGSFSLHVNASTVLGSAFLRLDTALPAHLRGKVTLVLCMADILSNAEDFAFMRNFARARGYRLALDNVTPQLLDTVDLTDAGFEIYDVKMTPALLKTDLSWRCLVPAQTEIVVSGLRRPSELRWSIEHGFRLGRGAMFSR